MGLFLTEILKTRRPPHEISCVAGMPVTQKQKQGKKSAYFQPVTGKQTVKSPSLRMKFHAQQVAALHREKIAE